MAVLTLAIFTAMAAPIVDAAPSPHRCASSHVDRTASQARPSVPQQLGDLPPASAIAAVWRFDQDGCPRPVVLKRGIGNNADRAVEPVGAVGSAFIR